MKQGQMEFCPFCGSSELSTEDESNRGPETYYTCPNCGTVGTMGVGYVPTQPK